MYSILLLSWLLGFSEGDGSFYFESHKNALFFSIKQKGNETLLIAIKDFFHNLASDKLIDKKESGVRIDAKDKGMFLLSVYNK